MFGIGMTELMVILVIGLIVLGPRRLPELARSLGRALGEFRRASTDLRQHLSGTLDEPHIQPNEAPEKKPDTPESPPAKQGREAAAQPAEGERRQAPAKPEASDG